MNAEAFYRIFLKSLENEKYLPNDTLCGIVRQILNGQINLLLRILFLAIIAYNISVNDVPRIIQPIYAVKKEAILI